jgi:hypothetical protein
MGKLISVLRFVRAPIGGLVLLLVGAGVLAFFVPSVIRSYNNQTWPSVPGKIVESRWQNKLVGTAANAKRPNYKFTPQIEYSYSVGTSEYRGTTVGLSSFEELDRGAAKNKLEEYALGRAVLVYYDPSNPEKSCLEQEKPALGSIIGLIVVIVSFYGAFVIMRQGFRFNVAKDSV